MDAAAFVQGIYDACALPSVLITIYGSKTIQTALFKCIVLNGVIFLGSILLMDNLLVPFFSYCSAAFLNNPHSTSVVPVNTPQLHQFNSLSEAWSFWLGAFLWKLYYVLWIYPLYVTSFVLNTFWYQAIADRAYEIVYGKPTQSPQTYDWFLKRVSTDIYRCLLLLNYIVLTFIAHSVIPWPFGSILSFILFSFLVAFVSFEYKWVQKGWTLEKRIDYFEARSSYFFGFGLPCTVLTFFFPSFISAGIYAVLFPMYIIMANQAHPLPRTEKKRKERITGNKANDGGSIGSGSHKPDNDEQQNEPKRVRIFLIAVWMSDTIIYLICGGGRRINRSSRPRTQ
ncbi:etoposide-induced protein 2.4-domain-containing protein [Obelidium mucronatum]|nr:etoposide-induced protein 2.4-domain-containing protein [Obelidium mucronatum]